MAGQVVDPSPVPLGAGLRLFRWKTLLWLLGVVLGLLAVDYGVATYQEYAIAEKRRAKARLERMALFKLRADLQDFVMLSGNQYRVTLKLDNPFPEEDLYVMTPEVQVYIQEGTVWREVPSRPAASDSPGRVVMLTGLRTSDHLFEATVKKFEELIPGYMHIRVSNVMYVSRRGEPQRDDLVERVDNYYAYLKPHGADDREILRKNRFPGGTAPLWIGMPPH